MNTYRNVISEIRSMNKLMSSDQILNDRTIMNEVIDAANMIVKQSLEKRKYWSSPTLFTPVTCLEMEQVPLSECCEYTNPCDIAKSKKQLPKIGEGIYGLAIQSVLSSDRKTRFKESNPNRFANLLKLDLPKMGIYFWLMNNHLYVTNPETKAVDLFPYFTEPVANNILFPGEDCECKNHPPASSLCMNPLDQEFHFIDDRMSDLKRIVYDNIMRVYNGNAIDRTSNNNDETSK